MRNYLSEIKYYALEANRVLIVFFGGIIIVLCMLIYESSWCTYLMSWMANFCLILRLKDSKKIEGNLFNKYSLFLFVSYLYLFGRSALFSLGLININDMSNYYNIVSINKYLLFAVPSFYVFTIPMQLYENRKNNEINKESGSIREAVVIVCSVLLIISAPLYLRSVNNFVQMALEKGYAANFLENNVAGGLFENMRMFYVPSIVLLISNSRKRITQYFLLLLLLVPAVSYLFVGSRGNAMALFMCMLFLWVAEIKKNENSKKFLLVLIIIAVILLGLFSTLSKIRDHSLASPFEILDIFFESNIFEGVISTIKEIGSTIFVWIRVEEIVPSIVQFRFGYSYLASILACIPSGLIGHSFADDAALDVWLTEMYHADYGLGFSMLAESYCNFGYFGIVSIFFVGIFIFYCLSGNILKKAGIRYKNAISAISLYIFTNTARNALSLSVRNVFYGIVIPVLLIIVVCKILDKKK